MYLLEEQVSLLERYFPQLGIPPSHLALRSLQQAQAKSRLHDIDHVVGLGMLIMSGPRNWLHGPGQDFVLICLYSSGNAAMSGMALEPIGVGEEICLPATVGRGPEASSLCEWGRNLLGESTIASLGDRRVKSLNVGDFGDAG